MKTKIQIKTITGDLLFEFEDEDNSIRHTVEEAVRQNISLSGADLRFFNHKRVDLRGANLSKAKLNRANLSSVNLRGANLNGTNLRDANLSGANLIMADLRNANLIGANLMVTYLRKANLINADLKAADFRGTDLRNADLKYAHISNTDFRDADLRGANFKSTNLRYAYLSEANLRNAKNIPFIPTYLLEGEFIAWKKLPNGLIVKLKILEDSKRSRSTGDKCRCDKALVIEFQNKDGSKVDETVYINYQHSKCTYKVGEIVYADSWNDNRWTECTHGIHFFIDRQSAVDYYY